MRGQYRLARRRLDDAVPMRLHVEALQPRLMMSATYALTASGSETLVNTTTMGNQQLPAVAMNPSGASAAVWASDADGGAVFGQLYGAGGARSGSEFQISQTGAGAMNDPSVAMDTAGDFAVAWDVGGNSVYARLYNAAGTAVTAETLVTNSRAGPGRAAIAMAANGAFTVAFEGNAAADNDGVYAQRFTAAGVASGAATLLNSTTAGKQTNPSITVDSTGGDIIAWTDQSTPNWTIKSARLSTGGVVSAETTVGAVAGKSADFSSIATSPTGALIVAWQTNADPNPTDVIAQLYNASGTAVYASPITVNTYATGMETSPSVAMRADGSFAVAWQAQQEDGAGWGVYGQAFDSTGAAVGTEFRVNTTTNMDQKDPAVAFVGNSIVVVWDGAGTGDMNGVFVQRYSATGPANVAPTISLPSARTTDVNTPITLSSANADNPSVADSDADGGIERLAVTATDGEFSLASTAGLTFSAGDGSSAAAMTFTGTLANLNASLDGLQFTPTASFTGSASLAFTIDDLGNSGGGGAKSTSASLTIHVQSAPNGDVAPGAQRTIENTNLVFSPADDNAFYLSSSDNYVEISDSHGLLTLSTTSGITFGNSTANGQANISFSGSTAAMDAALKGLIYAPTANYVGADTLTLVTTNSGLLGLGLLGSSSSYPVSITVAATAPHVNQAPAVLAPGAQVVAENGSLMMSTAAGNPIDVSDSDAGGASEQVTIDATSGTVQLASTAGLTFAPGSAVGQNLVFSGTLAAIDSSLDGMVYNPASDFFGAGAVSITVNDMGNTGMGGAKTATATIAISVSEVNLAPVITSPPTANVDENTSITFSSAGGDAIALTDSDDDGAVEKFTLFSADGTFTLAATAGLTFNAGANGQGAMTFTGTLTAINADVDGLVFTPTSGFFGNAAITAGADDLGNTGAGGALTASAVVMTAVAQVNQPPAIAAPANQVTLRGMAIPFSTVYGNAITVSDVDGGANMEEVTLDVDQGKIALGSAAGLTFPGGIDPSGRSITFTATLANINAALASLVFTPNGNSPVSASLQISADDLGATGAGGSRTASATIAIGFVNSLNVTTTSDVADGNTDSIPALLSDPGADAKISLREAILACNATPGAHEIDFDIGGGGQRVISPATLLPQLNNPIVIDATTQPGYAGTPLIDLDGSAAPFGVDGFNVAANNCGFFGMAIYGFSGNGIDVLPLNANHITIQGNYIGINSAGTAIFNGAGVVLVNSADDTVGGADPSQRNVISGNYTYGIDIRGAASTGIVVSGNYVGTSPDGSTAIPNGQSGIYLDNAGGNLIGGASSAAGNLISGNAGDGIELTGSTATANVIERNRIGINAALTGPLGNGGAGISLSAGASSNVIGGAAGINSAGNTIAFNVQRGIDIIGANDDAILANAIYANGSLGIDLGGTGTVLPNGGAENPGAANDAMNFPVFTRVDLNGSTLQIAGFVGSASDQSAFAGARVELFKSDASSGNGQGAAYLGVVFADAHGNFSGSISSGALSAGDAITATATDAAGNTSEFSANSIVTRVALPAFTVPGTQSTHVDVAANFSGINTISIADPYALSQSVSLGISATNGTLGLADLTGLTFVSGANGRSAMIVTGTLSAINAALGGLTFTPTPRFTGGATIGLAFSDSFNDATAGVAILVTPIAHTPAPAISVPPPQAIAEEMPLVFSAANSNAIAFTDAYAVGAGDEVTVSAIHGAPTLRSTAGLIFSAAATGTLIFSGTAANLNAALDGLTFSPDPAYIGAAALQITVANPAIVESGAVLMSNATIAIDVTAVNHAPVLSAGGAASLSSIIDTNKNPAPIDVVSAVSAGGFDPISDIDVDSVQGIAVVGLSDPGGGQWQFRLAGKAWIGFGAVSDFGATLLPGNAQLRFVPAVGADGRAALSYRAWDETSGIAGAQNVDVSVNGGHTAFSANEAATSLQVAPPTAPPLLVANDGLTSDGASIASITAAALKAFETGSTSGQLTFTITAAPSAGMLVVAGHAARSGDQFTQADIDAGRLAYVPAAGAGVADAFSFVVTDAAGASLPSAVFHIRINSAPAIPSKPSAVPALTALPLSSTPIAPAGAVPVIAGASQIDSAFALGAATAESDISIPDAAGSSDAQGVAGGIGAFAGAAGSADRPRQQAGAGVLVTPLIGRPVSLPLAHAVERAAIEVNGVSAPVQRRRVETSVTPGESDLQSSRPDELALLIPDPTGAGAIGKLANLLGHHDTRGVDPLSATFNHDSPLWHDLDKLQDNLAANHKLRVIAGSASLVSVGMSVMYFVWAVRAGSILSSLISSMPAWKLVDPLPILDQMAASGRRRNKFGEEEDDETLESMVDGAARAA
jgi:hypothetical protein